MDIIRDNTSEETASNAAATEGFLKAFDAHADALFRYCLFRIGDRERAVDMTQDIFMKTWNHIYNNGSAIGNMRAFLYASARNLVIDEYRKRKPISSLDALEEDTGYEPSVDEYDSMINRLDGAEAIALLSQIPEPYNEAIFMRYVQELSLGEISDITGESENTIAVRIHRGIGKLQKLFNREIEKDNREGKK